MSTIRAVSVLSRTSREKHPTTSSSAGLEVLERMEHRGAESADNKTGDGAGI